MVRNRHRKSTISTFTEKKAMTPTNIIAEFKKIGIFSLDEHIFDECDFSPSLVTDQPNDASTSIRHLEKTKASTMLIFSKKIYGRLMTLRSEIWKHSKIIFYLQSK